MTELTRADLIRLAVPSVALTVLTYAFRSVDQYWVQGLSTAAQAAVGASVFVVIGLFALFELPALGAAPLIARATGAGDEERRRELLGAAMVTTLIAALIVAVLGVAGAGLIARSVGLEGDTAQAFITYWTALCATFLPYAFTPLIDSAFLSMGDSKRPMLLQALGLGANIVLTPLFIFDEAFGLSGLGWGIAGAAIASNLSRAVAAGIGLWLLAERTGLTLRHVRPGPAIAPILRLGAPLALGTLFYAGVYWLMLRTSISPLGPAVNAALGIGFSALEGVTWPTFHGLSIAVASLVGRALGAGRPELAERALRLASPITTGLGLTAAVVFWLGGERIAGAFSLDPEVRYEATLYATALAFTQLFVAYEALYEGVLSGAGATRQVFWLSAPLNLLRIPLAWLFAFPLGLGSMGVWWAINLTSVLKTGLKWWVVRRGDWRSLELR
jgi:MATE family multidrug resistance protein